MNLHTKKGFVCIIILAVLAMMLAIASCDDVTAPGGPSYSTPSDNGTDGDSDDDAGNDTDDDPVQPEKSYIGITDDDFFVKQDNSQCGPTSFYMIFKHYGDPYTDAVLSSTSECVATTILTGISEIFTTVVSASWISLWLDSMSDGVDCKNFYKKISDLSQCAGSVGTPFYSVVDGSCEITGEDHDEYDAESNTARRNQFDSIKKNFLEKEYPVILHLRRTYDDYPLVWYPGHYVVLMGYDTVAREVYIMDPFRDLETHQVMKVPYDSFIMERWYQTTGSMAYLYPDARWDGTWIGFHH